jgi:hypothetical protein
MPTATLHLAESDVDVVPVEAHATTTADVVTRVTRLLADKYGLQFRMFMLVERALARGERRREVVHLVPAGLAAEADP